MSKYVRDTKAGKSISAYVILNKKGQKVATVQAHYSDSGAVLVNVWDDQTGGVQSARADGYGYDKFTAALSGMVIDGHTMSNHCGSGGVPKMPKGRNTYPQDFKTKPGYSFANWVSVSRETGRKVYGSDFTERALAVLGREARPDMSESDWKAVTSKAQELESEWRASDDCETGWGSCFRKSGFDYLKALGYRVIQAI